MEPFNPIKYCESLLKSHESISIATLEKALMKVKSDLEQARDRSLSNIHKVQSSVQERGGMDILYNLLERQSRASKGLDSARLMVKELNTRYEETSKILEEKEMQRKNAVLIRDLIIELDHYNDSQSDIDIDPKHLIYLKHSLEVLDIPEYNTVKIIRHNKQLTASSSTSKISILRNSLKAMHLKR
jgi:hypothetical protein